MQAHYGYEDGSGEYYITIDTDKCDGCEDCVEACPAGVLEMIEEDPVEENRVAAVSDEHRRKIKDSCARCKPTGYVSLPCVGACEPRAIRHSW
jgi:ferredoxin